MALCRCLKDHAWPEGRKGREYIAYVKPVGYPETSSICGRCNNPGVIWLDSSEEIDYKNGQRIFEGPNNFTRMRADDSGIYK